MRGSRRPAAALLLALVLVSGCGASIFDDIGNAIGSAADTVGNALGDASDAVSSGLGTAADAVGGALGTAANATGDFVNGAVDSVRSGVSTALGAVAGAGEDLRDFLTGGEVTPLVPSIKYGPILTKTLVALQYAVRTNASDYGDEATELPLSDGGYVTVRHTGLNQVVVAFQAAGLNSRSIEEFNTTETVPYLEDWISTAQAPSLLQEVLRGVLEGGANGTLLDAIEEVVGNGEQPLHVIVTGQAAGGGLAALAGPALALAYPLANVDVQTFGMPWRGFNPQFSWAFDQLVQLYYIWPWNSSDVAAALNGTAPAAGPGRIDQVAAAVNASIFGPNTLGNATLLPNLPPSYPADYQAGARAPLGAIAPLPGPGPTPSDCPPLLCKSRDAAQAACLLWRPGNGTVLRGLPRSYLSSPGISGDAVVSWDAATQTAYMFFEGTDTRADWAQDLLLVQSDDFAPTNADVFEGVQVHRGFLNQFLSLTDAAAGPEHNITAVLLNMTRGEQPRRVVLAGHSLGSALASLGGVWASAVWPNASVTVVGTGTPKVGNAEWVKEFRAIVGRANRFVYEIDQVPSLPPLDSYHHLPNGIWFRANYTIAVNRPPFGLDDTTWNDHDCENLYLPAIGNATVLDVPGFVVDLPSGNASLPFYQTAG